ncbi:MAG: aminopeptidase [Kosmotoga sp.]|nr:MAG: aminopeptidase [Kosmotoga sp.]
MTHSSENAWFRVEKNEVEGFSKDYMEFLQKAKNERNSITFFENLLKSKGFISFDEANSKKQLETAEGIYLVKSSKAMVAFKLNSILENGFKLLAAHVDSPRLDLKPLPLQEKSGYLLLKTHYYGGVKKYHWLNVPLELIGVIYDKNGDLIEISVGGEESDPVFTISDLLPHLDDRKGSVNEVFKGKDLNALCATIPLKSEEKNAKDLVKLNVLKMLNEKYGITEEDFISAELQLVPAHKPKEVGFDRSMIGAYGQDDRVCSYTAIRALIESKKDDRNIGVLLLDKEEIGSTGTTGAKSYFWLNAISRLAALNGSEKPYEDTLKALDNSKMLSGDVCAAVNPMHEKVHDLTNAAKLGHGIVLVKYTGYKGKAGTNDASAEMIGSVRNLLNKNKINWQTSLLGEVDQGGGGTVAKFFAERGMDVLDAGTPILGMHSPFEISSKVDVFETYRAYKAFLEQ